LERYGNDEKEQQRIINDDMDFANIYSLWGEGVPSAKLSQPDEDETKISSTIMKSVSQLWDPRLSPYDSDDEPKSSAGSFPFEEFGVEWWDEVSDDGKEYRLSMMLADEEYEEEMEEEENVTPMTFEEFAEETEKLIEQVLDERKETEAIMNAPPNADFLVEKDISQTASLAASFEEVAASDEFEEMLMKMGADDNMLMKIADEKRENGPSADDNVSKIVSDIDIDVLEMDSSEKIEDSDIPKVSLDYEQ
jgi:hypothetical protein